MVQAAAARVRKNKARLLRGGSVWRDSHVQARAHNHEGARGAGGHSRNDDPVVVLKFSRPARDRVGLSVCAVSGNRICAWIQTRIDSQIPEAGFSRLRSATKIVPRTQCGRSLLRFSRHPRSTDSRRSDKSRRHTIKWTRRARADGNSSPLQAVTRMLDLVRVNDRF